MQGIGSVAILERLIAEPNWILTSMIGAILGAVIPPLTAFTWYAMRRFRHHPLCTTWYSYHLTFRDNKPVMLNGVYRITRGLRSSLLIRAENLADDDAGNSRKTLFYRGTMDREGGHYIMDLSGTSHKERLIIRFVERVPPNDDMLSGIWLAYDHDNHVAAGAQLFSRKPLSRDRAAAALRSWIATSPGAVRLRAAPWSRGPIGHLPAEDPSSGD